MRTVAALLALSVLALSAPVLAQTYAQPPGSRSPYHYRGYDDAYSLPPSDGCFCDDGGWRRRELSPVRVHVGGAVRADADHATPGLQTAIDFFRGPAGLRLSAMWFRVGSGEGIAQYAGELTLDLGGHSVWRPVIGAGAGLARTWKVDDAGNRVSGGANLGIGLMRAAIEYRLPIEGTDSRASLGLTGVLPAVKSESAPDLQGWVIAGLSIGIGF
ncbi:MAG: hypothetical protein HY898_26870 [Deltaproteobacteria bacterium]|nr:hypothetical protein [Deltaproteobacteria bacterium]